MFDLKEKYCVIQKRKKSYKEVGIRRTETLRKSNLQNHRNKKSYTQIPNIKILISLPIIFLLLKVPYNC